MKKIEARDEVDVASRADVVSLRRAAVLRQCLRVLEAFVAALTIRYHV